MANASVAAHPLAADLEHVLDRTAAMWRELGGARLFITGGTGFFGCWLLESFAWANDRLNLGAQAVVLTRNSEAFARKAPHLAANPNISLHAGDIRRFEFPAGEFSHVVHAATEASAQNRASDQLEMFDTITVGTRRALDFAQACGASRFLLTSSGAIYGRQPPELPRISEDYAGAPSPLDSRSVYGEGKRAAELLCALYAAQQESGRVRLETMIARCFAFVGAYLPLDGGYAIGNFIRDAHAGEPVRVAGDGTPRRSYLYASDLAVWLWTILFRGQSCRAYNVGSEREVSIAELAHIVAKELGTELGTELGAGDGAGGGVEIAQTAAKGAAVERYVPATRRARAELELSETVGLREAIKRTAANLNQ